MITRIFRILIHPQYIAEFEKAYKEVYIPLVMSQKGFISLSTGKPIENINLEYVMVTNWKNM